MGQVYRFTEGLAFQPPYGNTGALNTNLEFTVDYFAFTIHERELPYILGMLSIDPKICMPMPRGGMGYKDCLRYQNIAIFYNGQSDMGVHVEMTGKGCRDFETLNGNGWYSLMQQLTDERSKITRIDVAIDDRKGIFDLAIIEKKIRAGQVVMRFKKGSVYTSFGMSNDGYCDEGKTIYFGSTSSGIRIRMYDKALEQKQDAIWIRTELQMRDEHAMKFCAEFLTGKALGEMASGVLLNYVRFVEPEADSNRSRWETSPFWYEFVRTVSKISLSIRKSEKTIQQVDEWVSRQVAPSLAMLMKHFEGDMKFFLDYVKNGMNRLKPHQLAMIGEWSFEVGAK